MTSFWKFWQAEAPQADDALGQQIQQLRQQAPVPVIWMFGKTGSGKSSVIHSLTGAEGATIGEGYRPETKTSRRFDFPDSVDPLLTFLDTRGLGEAAYDPTGDIARFNDSTQLMIVTVRVTDHALQGLLEPLRRIRKATPQRHVLLVLTCLHEATGTIDISEGRDLFGQVVSDSQQHGSQGVSAVEIPVSLQRLVDQKVNQFEGLYDQMLPVDLTRLEDGFADPDFGGPRLRQAILDHLPHAYRQALMSLADADRANQSQRQRRALWQVLASSAMAATAGAVPVPWVDIPIVLGIQSHMAVRLAKIYEQPLTPAHWAMLSSAAGSRIAMRMAVREGLKFIPWLGIAAGAASSFAFTYALGMSWDWYFADLRRGHVPSADQLREVFADELLRGQQLWRAK